MPGKHRPGYQADYYQRRQQQRRAAQRVVDNHPDEYQQYLNEERSQQEAH